MSGTTPTSTPSGIVARLLEPSTWAGLSALAITGSTQAPANLQAYVLMAAALFGAIAVVMRERGSKSADEIAADALAAAQQIEANRPKGA